MSFSDMTEGLLGVCKEVLGQPMTYIDKNSISHEFTGIWSDAYLRIDADGNTISSAEPNVGVRLSDFNAMPEQDEVVNRQGKTYKVRNVEPDGEGGAVLVLERA